MSFAQQATRCASEGNSDARARFEQSQDALERGRATEAEARVRALLAEVDSPNARLVLARALVMQRRWVDAYRAFDETLLRAAHCSQLDAAEGRRRRYQSAIVDAARERDALVGRVALLSLRFTAPSAVSVRIDGAAAIELRAGASVAVEPGVRSLRIASDGYDETRVESAVTVGRLTEVNVSLRRTATRATPTVLRVTVLPPTAPRSVALVVAGAALCTAGVVAVGLSVGFWLRSRTAFDALSAQCDGQRCPGSDAFSMQLNDAEREQRAGLALTIAGSIAVATGAVLSLVGATHPPRPRTPSIALTPSGVSGVF